MSETVHVLVVDDDEGIGRAWCRVLEREGHAVEVAHTLALARVLIRATRVQERNYDVVVLDLNLPDGDGSELLEELEALSPQPRVGVVSANLDSQRVLELWGRCVVGMPKPLTRETMVTLVERLAREPIQADPVGQFCVAHELSPREALLLRRACEGKGMKEIADELGCKAASLKAAWTRIHDKTGIRTRRRVMSEAWSYESNKH